MTDPTARIGRWGASACLAVFLAAMLVPAPPLPETHHSDPGFATLIVGYFFTGIIFWPAHILFVVGIVKCVVGSVKRVAFVSALAAVAGVCTGGFAVADQFHKSTLLKHPAFPLWLLSLFLLLVLAVILDLSSSARKDRLR